MYAKTRILEDSNMKKLLGIVFFLLIVGALTVGIVFYARGYRPSGTKIQATGIVSIRSAPDGAQVYIDGESKGTTNLDLPALKPGLYTIKIVKSGFSPWEKEVEVKKEAVNQIEAVLFPISPTLRALTFSGVINPVVSPKGEKIVFSVRKPEENAGIWVLNLSTSPLPSFFTKDLMKLIADDEETIYSSSSYQFSPGGDQLLVTIKKEDKFLLFESFDENKTPKEVTLDIEKLKDGWENDRMISEKNSLQKLGVEAFELAETLTNLQFSPKKTKFIGIRADGTSVLYDSDPSLAPNQDPATYSLPKAIKYLWFPDGEHLIIVNEGSISIMGADTKNNITIYTGNFDPGLVIPWPDGSRIVITTSLNTSVRKTPDFYAIELR